VFDWLNIIDLAEVKSNNICEKTCGCEHRSLNVFDTFRNIKKTGVAIYVIHVQ